MKITSLTIGIVFLSLSLSADCSNTQDKLKRYIQSKKFLSSQNMKNRRDIASVNRDIKSFQRDLFLQERDLFAQERGLDALKNDKNSIQTCYLQY